MYKTNLIRKIAVYPLHPYLVCLYCLTKANADIHISVSYWFEMFELFLFFGGITAILQFVFAFIWNSNVNGSIVLSLLHFMNLFLVPIHKTINYILPSVERIRGSFSILIILWLLVAVFLFIKKKKHYTVVSQYLTILFLFFNIIDMSKWSYDALVDSKKVLLKQFTISKKAKNYNIYLIVPDGYTANESLTKYWHFDNNAFVSNLRNKGFFIPKTPHSNYRYTAQSVSLMLNLNYFETSITEQFMEAIIGDNNLMHLLSSKKYQCSVFDYRNHDYIFNPNTIKLNIKNYLYRQSALQVLGFIFHIYPNLENTSIVADNDVVFGRISHLIESQKTDSSFRQFAYCHTMLTHYPFTNKRDETPDTKLMQLFSFDLSGKWTAVFDNQSRTLGTEGDSLLMNLYLLKVKQTNDSLKTILNKYWNEINGNSIVIIMGDHGFRQIPGAPIDFQAEAFSNFCAVYFPDRDYSTLTDTITPINVLRMTLNKAVGTDLPYLPDRTNLR